MEEQQDPRVEALTRQFLQEALEEVLSSDGRPAPDGTPACDAESLEVLRQTAQVAAALQQLKLGTGDSGAGSTPAVAAVQSLAADPSAASSADPDPALFAGPPGGRLLGVSADDLLAEALLPEAARRQALCAAMPAVEAVLRRRCAEVAAACGYGSMQDFTGLPAHIRQLQATAASHQSTQVEAWQRAAQQADEAVGTLAEACQCLADIVQQHKLQGHKEASEAQAAALRASCTMLREKLRVVELQLKDATYNSSTVPVLQQVAEEVEGRLQEAADELQQATTRLAQYRALGPAFAALAAEYKGVLEAIEEAEYELREIEQFREQFRVLEEVNG